MKNELIEEVSEVREVHDIHIWQVTDSIYNMTAHVVTENININETTPVLKKINDFLSEKYRINHLVVQFEARDHPDHK